jgi:hypothetical protein
MRAPSGVLVLGMAGWIDQRRERGSPCPRARTAAMAGEGRIREWLCDAVAVPTADDRLLMVRASSSPSPFDGEPVIAILSVSVFRGPRPRTSTVHERKTIPLQPSLEADVPPSTSPRSGAHHATTDTAVRAMCHRSGLSRGQWVPPTLAYGIHIGRLDVRSRKIHPRPVQTPSTPGVIALTTRFTETAGRTTGFAVKRLDWMTADTGAVT